jgi:hypothetical protein
MALFAELENVLSEFLDPQPILPLIPYSFDTQDVIREPTFIDRVTSNPAQYLPMKPRTDPLASVMQKLLEYSLSPSAALPAATLSSIHSLLQEELVRPVQGALFCFSLLNIISPQYDPLQASYRISHDVVSAMALKQEILEFVQIILSSHPPTYRESMYSHMSISELQTHATDLISAAISISSAQTGFDPFFFFQRQ